MNNLKFLQGIIEFGLLLTIVHGTCLDRPQLFIHKRDGIHEVLDLEQKGYVTIQDPSREYLTCRSSQNLEWHYLGQGEPSKFQESTSISIKREIDDSSLEYCTTSRVSFYPKQSDTDLSKHTGRYICQEIGNSSNQVSSYVFTGRRNAPVFLQSRQNISLPLSHENVTNFSFLIPCVTSTSLVNATLMRRHPGASKFKAIWSSTTRGESNSSSEDQSAPVAAFDPRSGFRVRVGVSGQNLSSFYGEYKCIAKISPGSLGKQVNQKEDFVIYNLVKPPTFRAYPPGQIVYTSGVLNLTCESTEESVILKEVKSRPGAFRNDYAYEDDNQDDADVNSNSVEDIEETIEKTENKLHVANYLEMNPVAGSFGEFQCLSEKDKKVLHSWTYRVLDKKEEKLSGIKFNKRDNSFSCRAKSGMPGKLSFVSCRTPSECRINGICLGKSEGCRGYSNATKALCHRGNHFCGKIFYKGGSGLIRCVGEGIDQVRGFTDEANDQRLRMGFHKLKPSETAYLSVIPSSSNEGGDHAHDGSFLEGENVDISLKLGYYYFVQPVQWAVKFRNGSSAHLTPEKETIEANKLHRTIKAKLRLPLSTSTIHKNRKKDGESSGGKSFKRESEIVGINALIPLRSSVPPSWKTITMPMQVVLVGAGTEPEPESVEMRSEQIETDETSASATGRSDIQFEEVTENGNLIDQVQVQTATEPVTDTTLLEEGVKNDRGLNAQPVYDETDSTTMRF